MRGLRLGLGLTDRRGQAAPAAPAAALDPADFQAYYDVEDAHVTLTGTDIDAYLDQGTAGVNCTNVFGGDNQQSGTLDGKKTSVGAVSNDNWYRSAANASGVLAEGAGCFVFIFKPTSVAENKVLWALENTAHGIIYLLDDAGTKKARATLGSGGQQVIVTSGAVTLNAWHVLIVRYNGAVVDMYLDNDAKVTATGAGGDVLATRLAQRYQILSNGGGNCLQGSMALVAIRNTCPDDAGIIALKAEIDGSYPSAGL